VEFGPGMTSATQIRTAWPTLDQRRKTALVMSLYPKTQGNAKLAATVVKLLDAAIGSVSDVAEGIEDNYNKNDAGVKAALQSGVKLIPIQPNNDATGKPIYIHDYSGRYTVAVDIGGISVPFYVSTGLGGKAGVAVDKWYPFFGIGPDGWINKGSEATINDFYGSNKLKRVAQVLDNTLGLPSRAKNVTGWPVTRGDENYFISIVNRGLDPAARSDRSTKLRDNMLSVLRRLGEPNKYVEKAVPVQAARPKAAFVKNNPEHVAAFDATSQSEREIAMALAKDPKSQGVAEGYKEERLKGCKCQHRQGDNKKCPIHGVQEGVAEGKIDEGWKETLGAATLAGAMALGSAGAQARVTPDGQGGFTGGMKPAATVTAPVPARIDSPSGPSGFSKEYLQKAADPNRTGRYMISIEKAQELLKQTNEGAAGLPDPNNFDSDWEYQDALDAYGKTQDNDSDFENMTDEPDDWFDESKEKVGNMDADDFDAAMARLKKLAGAGPMKTVYDPDRRMYRNMPTAQQPPKQPKK
jgi:hypothetical protein